jgi:hypothetical protein
MKAALKGGLKLAKAGHYGVDCANGLQALEFDDSHDHQRQFSPNVVVLF